MLEILLGVFIDATTKVWATSNPLPTYTAYAYYEPPPEPVMPPPEAVVVVPGGVYNNCAEYVHTLDPRIPFQDASMFKPNVDVPSIGDVAIFYYPRSGLWHVAYVANVSNMGVVLMEENYHAGERTVRYTPFSDSRLVGFWSVSGP